MEFDVILVGAGLSGAAFLAHLLRDHPGFRSRVLAIEPAARLGAGLAYGTDDPAHRTNVAAGRMSLFPEQPEHFVQWLDGRGEVSRDPEALGSDGLVHARRTIYGDYADDTVRAEIDASPASIRHLRQRAVSAARRPEGGWEVALEDGSVAAAPLLVLAVGHTAPDLPAVLAPVARDPRVVADPWDRAALDRIGGEDPVLVVGTGLTGCDVIAGLRARGHRGAVLAVSRRGLLPRLRTTKPVGEWGDFASDPATDALSLLRRVREAVAAAGVAGRPWEDVIAALRVQARTVWGSLPVGERRRLLRHLRPFWDVHRFQCAPQIAAVVAAGQREGWLTVLAATPVAVGADADGIAMTLRRRGGRMTDTVRVQAVVNCTGPGHRSVVAAHPLLHSLAEAGHLRADPCRLGIDVDERSRVLDASGAAWSDLFVAGPLARGTHGELMGLPQVTTQPREVAEAVARLAAPLM